MIKIKRNTIKNKMHKNPIIYSLIKTKLKN